MKQLVDQPTTRSRFEQISEWLLWKTRYLMVVAVLLSLIAAATIFVLSMVEITHLISIGWQFLLGDSTPEIRQKAMYIVIELLDSFLMTGVLFIFAFGLYELFISQLEPAQNKSQQGRILNIESIDVLKAKLGKVILMMLVIKAFSYTLKLEVLSALDFLMMCGAILLISAALFLSNFGHGHSPAQLVEPSNAKSNEKSIETSTVASTEQSAA